ncbi:hypothetical protein HHI36_018010 [Cryptolaemus montrouzieri]|uniref:Uncharacterized protein n=1 Tax=Cryptolaemus montrouzieri TaxID=559131 RepID=A0ABD2NYX0_9CUCU
MYNRSDPPEQWSVYAEFTISHPGLGDPENVPITRTEQNDSGVRMTYSWNSQRNAQNQRQTWSGTANIPSETASNHSTSEPFGGYGFQKGNLLFTSTPASRRPFQFQTPSSSRLNAPESSGYDSNIQSPNTLSSSTSLQQHDGRRCRSTCNITLCSNPVSSDTCHHHCGRTQSLRCQTPSSRSDCKNVYYGCGDPWCHHLRSGDDISVGGRCSPVPEVCEDCPSLSGRSHKATRSLSRELEGRKDVSVQTFEMVDKCTSPYLKIEDEKIVRTAKNPRKVRRRSLSYHRSISQRSHSPSSFTPDSLESASQTRRRLTRSPKLKRMPQLKNDDSQLTTTTNTTTDDKSSGSKKPRTVHIDVYCTGTENESDSTDSDISDNDTESTPQTVFESKQVRITHKRADAKDLPINIKEDVKENQSSHIFSQQPSEKQDSDLDDSLSTAYPSKLSSYSTIKDYTSSFSSVPRSWTNYSMSSCAIPDIDCDSIANTSWKDNTYSDLDSALQSRSSIAGTESLLFVPKKLRIKKDSIDETPELQKVESKSPSGVSLHQSDSFEYANSEDKLRIKRMEAMLEKGEERRRVTERWEERHREQQRKMNEYIQKKLKRLAKKESKESESDDSADSGKGWTFVEDDSRKVKKDGLMEKSNNESSKNEPITKTPDLASVSDASNTKKPRQQLKNSSERKKDLVEQGSMSDSSPSPSCRTPSSVVLMQRLSIDPTLRAPFTIAPGQYTEQRSIAKKFGPVISAFRKPGHHIGPVRNPECSCAHCRRYFETVGFRSRTRSVGDPPSNNWKDFLNPQ